MELYVCSFYISGGVSSLYLQWKSSLTKLAKLDFAVSDTNGMGVDEATVS